MAIRSCRASAVHFSANPRLDLRPQKVNRRLSAITVFLRYRECGVPFANPVQGCSADTDELAHAPDFDQCVRVVLLLQCLCSYLVHYSINHMFDSDEPVPGRLFPGPPIPYGFTSHSPARFSRARQVPQASIGSICSRTRHRARQTRTR